jgi:peptidoglycan/LPS O-acetylase OafA/YrhL
MRYYIGTVFVESSVKNAMPGVTGDSAERDYFPVLDLVRFSAALLVMFGHVRGLLLVGIGSVPEHSWPVRLFYLITGLQHEGVVLFFVVSGFLVGGPAWRRMGSGRFSIFDYLLNRFTRIYLVLIPALVLVGIISAIGFATFAATRFYAERPLLPSGVSVGWSWGQVPCHLLAVQGVLCKPWGVDPPLWSLGFEWVFYLVGPALFAVALVPMRPWTRFALAGAVAVIMFELYDANPAFGRWFAIWLLGVFAAVISRRWNIPVLVGVGGLILCSAAMIVSRTKVLALEETDALVGIGIAIALSCPRLTRLKFDSSVIRQGARFSYSLYLIHLPLCVFFGALLEGLFGWPSTLVQPHWPAIAAFAAMVGFALLSSWLFAMATEANTDAVRGHFVKFANALITGKKIARLRTRSAP